MLRTSASPANTFDAVYASTIFSRTQPLLPIVYELYPHAIIGGTGSDDTITLEHLEVGIAQDYSIYPAFQHSIGYSQRGCRLKCKFCMVPTMEGAAKFEQGILQIWRGDPYPRNLLLLDNDFFGVPEWREAIKTIRDGDFKVCFNQGINIRMIGPEEADAIASVNYRDDSFERRRLYTAWDNAKDEARLFRGLQLLVDRGVNPRNIMVYMLCGYWPGETHEDREMRRKKLCDFGCLPYPMVYTYPPDYKKPSDLSGYQRWIIRRYYQKVSWEIFCKAKWRPDKVNEFLPSSS